MRFWAINERLYSPLNSTVAIEGRRRPQCRRGDRLVLFASEGRTVAFTHSATLVRTNVQEKTLSRGEGSIVAFEGQLGEIARLEPARQLADFAYSLKRVYRYEEPFRHFNRQYVSLTRLDHTTIVDARIFWARTAFATFLNSLPVEAIDQFIRILAAGSPGMITGSVPYSSLWASLRDHLVAEYVGARDLIEALASSAEQLAGRGIEVPFESLRLGSDEDRGGDSISEQRRRVSRFVTHLTISPLEGAGDSAVSLLTEIDQRIREGEVSASEFEEDFRGTPWPTLKTLSF